MARAPVAKQPRTSKRTSNVTPAIETLRGLLDIIKTLVIIAALGGGLFFIYDNRSDLRDLITNINKFEFAGLKAEFARRSYQEYEVQRAAALGEKGLLKPEYHNAIHFRASWLAPILNSAQILWVDDEPEVNNAEIQILSKYQVKIRFARDNDQAMEELKKQRFDLVISDIDRRGQKLPDGARLSKCPVHWFAVPEKEQREKGISKEEPQDSQKQKALLASWNESSNSTPFVGFHLAERMINHFGNKNTVYWAATGIWIKDATQETEEIIENFPPIIFYSQFDMRMSTPCSDTITWDAYTLLHSVLDLLEKRRWRYFARYTPPSEKDKKALEAPASLTVVHE